MIDTWPKENRSTTEIYKTIQKKALSWFILNIIVLHCLLLHFFTRKQITSTLSYVTKRRRLGILSVVEIKRWGRLRWFGHVERTEVYDWVSACRNLEVAGSRGRGRPRMTWRARLDGDMMDMELGPGMAMDREKWRCGIMGRTSDPHKRGNNGR